jgi:hypothetical protein
MDTYQIILSVIAVVNVIGGLVLVPLFNRIAKIEDKLDSFVIKDDLNRHLDRVESQLKQVNDNILRLMEIKSK